MSSGSAGNGNGDGDGGRDSQRRELSEWQQRVKRRVGFAAGGSDSALALMAAGNAIAAEIDAGELRAKGVELEVRCDRVLEIHTALIDLAHIANDGVAGNWPTRDRAANADAWHNSYVKLADRISRGKVDLERPLRPLAALAALQCFIDERDKQQRLFPLSETQVHRFNIAAAVPLEVRAETARRRSALRREIGALLRDGSLAKRELEILTARYVREMTSQEVAAEMEMTPANVRQLCRRRCAQLRHQLSGLDLEDAAEAAA